MLDSVEKEWRRLLRALSKDGADATSRYVSGLIRDERYSIYYGVRLSRLLLKRGETSAAGRILREIMAIGQPDPLVDELYSSWLWCSGHRKRAILFVEQKAKFWSRSYLYEQLGAFYKLCGEPQKADDNFRMAALRAELEDKMRQHSKGSDSKQ
jgi:hypothetical protein